MNNLISKVVFCLLVFCFFITQVIAQQNHFDTGKQDSIKNKSLFWLSLGGGISFTETTSWASFYVNGSYLYKKYKKIVVNFRYINSFGGGDREASYPVETSDEISLLVGIYKKWNKFYCAGLTGISTENGIKRGKFLYSRYSGGWLVGAQYNYYEEIDYDAVGLPVEIQTLWFVSKYFGFGTTAFAEFNRERNRWGIILFTLHVGKIR